MVIYYCLLQKVVCREVFSTHHFRLPGYCTLVILPFDPLTLYSTTRAGVDLTWGAQSHNLLVKM